MFDLQYPTLKSATTPYRLRDGGMNHIDIAKNLGLKHLSIDSADTHGCLFYNNSGGVVAIRTKTDELVVFDFYDDIKTKMHLIGDKIKIQ